MDIKGFIKSIPWLSDNTRRNYQASLELLERQIKGDEPTADDIKAFLDGYKAASSLQRHKAAIYRYWQYRFPKQDWNFNRDSFRNVKKRIPKYTEPYVVDQMIESSKDPDDTMFVKTLYIFGCRIRELLRAEASDIIGTGIITTVKGGDQQVKVCPPDFLKKLIAYAGTREGLIFPRGYDYYYTLIKRLGEAVGHPEMSPHMLRHARGIDLIDKGWDTAWVAQYLGHKTLSTVMIYLQLSKGGLQARLQKVEGKNNV
jgi:integrase